MNRPASLSIVAKPPRSPAATRPVAAAEGGTTLDAVMRRIATFTGHDFSAYKPSTLERRIERRMGIHGLVSMADYVGLLNDSGPETELLFKELLIGVTAFFREPPLWRVVGDAVLPALLAAPPRGTDPTLRVWVVACSTGEEAYTLAMLVREALDAGKPGQTPRPVQIFATDLNAEAIQFARRGVYPASIAESMSAERLARFFVEENGAYRVAKCLRDMVLFACHDVVTDPPFMRVDLVSCRNLLIYFKTSLQNRLLPLFHYVLRPGGHLLLGNSETIGRHDDLFTPVEATWRVFRRSAVVVTNASAFFPVKLTVMPAAVPDQPIPAEAAAPAATSLQLLVGHLMVEEFAPPAVLVGAQGDILYVSGRTGRFLEPATGQANLNLYAMARQGLRHALGNAFRQVLASGVAVEVNGLFAEPDGAGPGVDLLLRPVDLAGHNGLVLVVFKERTATAELPPAPRGGRRSGRDTQLRRAIEEAQALREEMRSSQEELQSTNEELQSTNEELQSANEELQSANEEMTSSKEEMQAMNEELQTVNAELMSKLDDLALAQSDLKNLLNSTHIATLFLDGAMNVRRFTERAKKVINLRDSDIGRPLSDLTTTLEYPALADDIARVLRTLEFHEQDIRTGNGAWYTVRIMPYRTQDNVIDGSVITFADITAAKALEARLRADGNGV